MVTIVVVLPSSGSRYLQHPMWDRLRSEAAQLGAALLLVVLARELEVTTHLDLTTPRRWPLNSVIPPYGSLKWIPL